MLDPDTKRLPSIKTFPLNVPLLKVTSLVVPNPTVVAVIVPDVLVKSIPPCPVVSLNVKPDW